MSTKPPAPIVMASGETPVGGLIPQRHGGALRRGNPGNKSHRSAIAREILEASTPQAARILMHMSLKGEDPNTKERLSTPDRIAALKAHLDRGKVPPRTDIGAADGSSAFTIVVGVPGEATEQARVWSPAEPAGQLPAPKRNEAIATPVVRASALPASR